MSRLTNENPIATQIVDAAVKIHKKLGPGLFESVYEVALAYELTQRGLRFRRQQALPVVYEEIRLDRGFRADLVVEGCVIVEVKSLEAVSVIHKQQLLTYLRLSDMRLGLLLNFGAAAMREGIKRLVN